MKRLALLALVLGAMGGCFEDDKDEPKICWAIGPHPGEERSCSFVAPSPPNDPPEYSCEHIKYVKFDGKRLSNNEVSIECFADGTSQITVLRDECATHFVGVCIE